jgi:hypothetical protein
VLIASSKERSQKNLFLAWLEILGAGYLAAVIWPDNGLSLGLFLSDSRYCSHFSPGGATAASLNSGVADSVSRTLFALGVF